MEKLYLGIELGSTRIKCSLIDKFGQSVATGVSEWDNQFINNFWTYDLNDSLDLISKAYLDLKDNYEKVRGAKLKKISCIGISAMMHGLIALDKNGKLLTPFRTWRNNNTAECAEELSRLLGFNIPARWSISHLYYCIKNNEEFVHDIASIDTLASFVHSKLTKERCIGVDDASGMFPLDDKGNYNKEYLSKVNDLFASYGFNKKVEDLLPKIVPVGEVAGLLKEEGCSILDIEGHLTPGIPFCPPEGDAGTGMIATNSIKVKCGNISAGTSIFGNFVLEKALPNWYPEIDIVNTSDGNYVAMVHCNNCNSSINTTYELVRDVLNTFNVRMNTDEIFATLFNTSLSSIESLEGFTMCNYLSGENITKVDDGAMYLAWSKKSKLNLSNLVVSSVFASFVTLSLGLDILVKEGLELEDVYAHGGIFKTRGGSQKLLAAVLDRPVYVNAQASEGGAWGMALLALYVDYKNKYSLVDYLDKVIFKNSQNIVERPEMKFKKMFKDYKETFARCLEAERILGKELNR